MRRTAKGKKEEERGGDGASNAEIRTHGSVSKHRASAFYRYSFQLGEIKLQPQAAIFLKGTLHLVSLMTLQD